MLIPLSDFIKLPNNLTHNWQIVFPEEYKLLTMTCVMFSQTKCVKSNKTVSKKKFLFMELEDGSVYKALSSFIDKNINKERWIEQVFYAKGDKNSRGVVLAKNIFVLACGEAKIYRNLDNSFRPPLYVKLRLTDQIGR